MAEPLSPSQKASRRLINMPSALLIFFTATAEYYDRRKESK